MMSTWTGSITDYKTWYYQGKTFMWSLKTMYKAGETDTPEELSIDEGNFKAMFFLIRADEYIYEQQLE